MATFQHTPVLVSEVCSLLQASSNKNFIDGTVGGGGHAQALLDLTAPHGKLLGCDLDAQAVAAAAERLAGYGERLTLRLINYKQIQTLKDDLSVLNPISGLVLDLGLSSYQLDTAERGFSFHEQGSLDMRFDTRSGLRADDILRSWSEEELGTLFREYGEERDWRKVARAIVALRKEKPEFGVQDLVQLIESIIPRWQRSLHPATKAFQALRIAVNKELDNIQEFLPTIFTFLPVGARLAIISFHSLEDRIVKQYFQAESRDCICPPNIPLCRCGHKARLKIITKKLIRPSETEVQRNPRSRSALLRVAEVLAYE